MGRNRGTVSKRVSPFIKVDSGPSLAPGTKQITVDEGFFPGPDSDFSSWTIISFSDQLTLSAIQGSSPASDNTFVVGN